MGPKVDKQQAILDAALALFAERGFHGTSVPDLAARADVGAGTIYRYFESKEALVNHLYRHWKQVLLADLLDRFPFDSSWREQLRAVWYRMADFAREHPTALYFLELHHHAPYLDAESRALEAASTAMIKERLSAGTAAEVLKDLPPEVLHALIHGCFVGLAREARAGELSLSDDIVQATEACVWEAIRR